MVFEFSENGDFSAFPEKLRKIIEVLLEKKAKDVVIIDMRKFMHIADFFVLCTCDSGPQRKAVVEQFEEKFKGEILFVDFNPASGWNVVDFEDIVVHVFDEETRKFYDLEGLWTDARQFRVQE